MAQADRITFTLNAIYTNAINITITSFGYKRNNPGVDVGTSANGYKVSFLNPDTGITRYFNSSSNFFTLNVAKTILFNDPGWNIPPAVSVDDNIIVTIDNNTYTLPDNNRSSIGLQKTVINILQFTLTSATTTGFTVNVSTLPTGYQSSDTYIFNLYKNGTLIGVYSFVWNPSLGTTTISFSSLSGSPAFSLTGGDTFNVGISSPIDETLRYANLNTGINTPTTNNVTVGGGGGGIPCFVAASNLLTPSGYKSAADIKTGDLLLTADGRQVAVKSHSFTVDKADKDSAPFFIPKNSISMGCPTADLRLSPWHAFQMKKGLWMKPMSALELGMPVKQYDIGKPVTYYHFEAPDYFKDNFVCDGTVVESFGVLQTKHMKSRVYTYNSTLKGYTRASAKSVSKTIMM